MNKMTNKQYLVDVTLKSLEVSRPSRTATKVLCEIHYGEGDSYLRIKMQPVLKQGIASFYEERIRIPYSAEIALVFKIFKGRKQIFLGHYTIEAEKYLQQKKYTIQLKQKLEEADAWVDFEVKIIDKQLFCDEESDCLDDEDLLPTAKSNYSEDFKSIARLSDYKAKSEYNTPFLIIKRQQNLQTPPSHSQFEKLLISVDDLLLKHRAMAQKNSILNQFQADPTQSIKNSTIKELKQQLLKAKQDSLINTYCIMGVTGFLGLLTGLLI